MIWLSLITDFIVKTGGFIIAGLSLYFMWKSRTSAYRETLYSKQLEGYLMLTESIIKIALSERSVETLTTSIREFGENLVKWMYVLPPSLAIAFEKFYSTARNELRKMEKGTSFGEEALRDAFSEVSKAVNLCFGVSSLTQETSDLIAKISSKTN